MKKIIITLALISFFATNCSYAQSDPAYAKTLKRMFEVSGSAEAFKVAITQMVSMYKSQYTEIDPKIWDEFEAEFLKTSLTELVEMLVPVYSKYMTKSDLEQLIRFYESPVGVKYAKHTPQITQESMQVGQEWGMKVGQEIGRRIQERSK